MKILILTDSLGLPRSKPELCSFEDTWPTLLRDRYPNIHQVSIGAATSQVLLKQINYQKAFKPDIVILQVGIVDCAPRFMSRKELDFTYALGNLGRGFRFMLNRNWIKRKRKISYINEVEFKQNLTKIQDAFDCPAISIGILPSNKQYEKLLPGVTAKIVSYNTILEQNFINFLNTDDIINVNGIMSDHHHLNKKGHNYLFHKIEKSLKELLK
jgi:lysophospholipase L1-like esterase